MRTAFAIAALLPWASPVHADALSEIRDVVAKGAKEQHLVLTCSNGDRESRTMLEDVFRSDIEKAFATLRREDEALPAAAIDELEAQAREALDIDLTMTLAEQRRLCDADPDWRKRLVYFEIVHYPNAFEKILKER